jgi:hypothetical protein
MNSDDGAFVSCSSRTAHRNASKQASTLRREVPAYPVRVFAVAGRTGLSAAAGDAGEWPAARGGIGEAAAVLGADEDHLPSGKAGRGGRDVVG